VEDQQRAVRLAAPILVFTAERNLEVFAESAGRNRKRAYDVVPEAVALACGIARDAAEKWERLAPVRSAVLVASNKPAPRRSSRRPRSESPSTRGAGSSGLAETARRKTVRSPCALHRFASRDPSVRHRGFRSSRNIARSDDQDRAGRRREMRALLELFEARRRKLPLPDRCERCTKPSRNRERRVCKRSGDLKCSPPPLP